jgi:hypothetical protein
MAEPQFTIRQGDTASTLYDQLLDADGNPVDITGAAVALKLVPLEGGEPIVDNEAAIITDAAQALVERDWQSGETDAPGFYLGSWRVTFSGGDVQTYPNAGFFLVRITEHAPVVLGSLYLTVEDMKDTLELSGLGYADKDIARSISAASRAVDSYCNRRFYLSPEASLPADEERLYSPSKGTLWLPIDDLAELGSVEVKDGSGAWQPWLLDDDYLLEPSNAAALGEPYSRLRIETSRSSFIYDWPASFYGSSASVKVTGRWGWPSLPDEVVQATQLVATQLLRRIREAPFGVVAIGLEGEAVRLSKADPQLVQLLGGLRRRRGIVLA